MTGTVYSIGGLTEVKRELWDEEEKELLESTRGIWENPTILPYKIASDLRAKGCSEPFVKKLILSLSFLRAKKFIIVISKASNSLRLKVEGWDEAFIRIPLPRTKEGYDENEFYRDDIYTTLVEHGFGEEVSQEISSAEIVEV